MTPEGDRIMRLSIYVLKKHEIKKYTSSDYGAEILLCEGCSWRGTSESEAIFHRGQEIGLAVDRDET